MPHKSFQVSNKEENKRLDLFLAVNWDKLSRSAIKRLIESNQVKVNGEVEYNSNYKVKSGDKIYVEYEEVKGNPAAMPEDIPIDVVYEDDGLVIVNKPEGMVVHPATGNRKGTLINALLFRYKDLSQVGTRIRSGLINRIDKATSGLVLVGKTNEALWYYSKQFANREVNKEYLAVVRGDVSRLFKDKSEIEIRNSLARNPVKRKKMAIAERGKGKSAVTKFSLIAISKEKKYSLIKAKPMTGRTHQIRVHLSSLGHPVIGDRKYSGPKYKRLLLHSYRVRLISLDGKDLDVRAKVSGEYKTFLLENFDERVVKYIK